MFPWGIHDKAKAIAQYNAVVKQLEACLEIKGETIPHESLDRLQVFTKEKPEIAPIEKTGK